MVARLFAGASAAAVVLGGAGSGAAPGPAVPAPIPGPQASSGGEYLAPLPGPLHVLRGFDPPATPYGPGHLGVDLRAAPAQVVRAAGAGVVRFAGPVAGRGVVVIAHRDGISTEYEPLRPAVRAGTPVRAGQPIGVLRGRHVGCSRCLHWGARRGQAYINPLDLLRPLGPVVLLPWPRDG